MSQQNMKSKSESYIVIKDWMVSKLGLKVHVSKGLTKPSYYLCDYWATITRFPAADQEKILNNWANFSTAYFPKPDE